MMRNASKGAIPMDALARLYRGLSYLTSGGISASDAASVLLENGGVGPESGVLIKLCASEAPPLSTVMDDFPRTFTPETVALVREGESHSALHAVLDMLAQDSDMRAQMRKRLPRILLWPAALMILLSLVTAILLIFVVPAFKEVYSSFGADLPGTTVLVIRVSDAVVSYWWLAAAIVAVALYAIRRQRRSNAGDAIDRLLLKIPGVRRLLVRILAARAAALLAGAGAANIPFVAAMASLRSTLWNRYLRAQLQLVEASLSEGDSLAQAWRSQSLLPLGIASLADIGARSGRQPEALARAAALHLVEADDALLYSGQTLLLVTYIVAGLVVGITVFAMYLPIFKLGAVI